jgi:hypothetical protein
VVETYQSLKVFVSSPSDVPEERAIAESVIADVNKSCRDTIGIAADAHTWKHLPPLTPSMPSETIQRIINEEVRECNAFVLILYKRYGTVERGQTKSNTEREIEVALNMLSEGRRIMFLSYFRELPANADAGEQEAKVRQLRDDLGNRGVLYHTYTDPPEFRYRFTHDLYHTILRFHASTTKQRALKSFWQLGIREGSVHPQLAIVYPPVDRHFMREQKPDRFWLQRLVPHIVFEDFKALQKIEKTLRLIGFRNFQFYSVQGRPNNFDDMNRMWICLPRNEPAQRQLELYKDRLRFGFLRGAGATKIRWRRTTKSSNWIAVQSPLAKYLQIQRQRMTGGEWQTAHGHVFAKDFAVLARFSDVRGRQPMSQGTLKDFFLAGIRGLGTWGAGWFLDRRYNSLLDPCDRENADVQFLLEVSYKNERIFDVQDVSDEPESYFLEENNPRTIRARIREHM